jgi:hypothetical protein
MNHLDCMTSGVSASNSDRVAIIINTLIGARTGDFWLGLSPDHMCIHKQTSQVEPISGWLATKSDSQYVVLKLELIII